MTQQPGLHDSGVGTKDHRRFAAATPARRTGGALDARRLSSGEAGGDDHVRSARFTARWRLTPRQSLTVQPYLEHGGEVITRYWARSTDYRDAILVLFGAPMPCAEHASRALACSLAMQLAMADVNRRLAGQGAPELEMGIGIHTGPVIVGNIGSLRRTKYAAVGSNVNLAGRIESFTTGGQILISEHTRKKIQAPLRIDREFRVEPKGASGSLQLFEVGGLGAPFNLAVPMRSASLHELPNPLPIRFTVLEEKFVGRTVHEGRLTEASGNGARFQCEAVPPPLCNLKILVQAMPGGNPAGEIYAKVVESSAGPPGLARIHFTSVTPELKAWICSVTAARAESATP